MELETTADLTALNVPVQIKALDTEKRTFEGLAATWDLDLGDDVIHRGAFKEWISEWRRKKNAVPLLDTHNSFSVFSAVGKLLDTKETAAGLWTKWEIIDGPDGDGIMTRLKSGIITSMSIGYRPLKYDFEDSEEARFGQIRNLLKVELHEVSLVLRPMNPNAVIDTDSVKALLELKSMTAVQITTLRQLHAEIGKKLAELGGAPAEEPEPKDPAQEEKEEPTAEEGEPDTSALDALRLRRLGYNTNQGEQG